MRKLLFTGLMLLALAVLAWAATITTRTDIWQFENGLRVCKGCTTITGSTTAGNASVVLPTSSVGALEQNATTVAVVFCAELAENSTVYGGPIPLTTPPPALDATACDTLTHGTETSADARIFPSGSATLRPMHMSCVTAATLGSEESLVATLRDDAADYQAASADFACSIGEAALTCVEEDNGDTAEAAASLWTMQFTMASNNGDGEDGLCIVWFQVN